MQPLIIHRMVISILMLKSEAVAKNLNTKTKPHLLFITSCMPSIEHI